MTNAELGQDLLVTEDMDHLGRIDEGIRILVWDLIWRLRTARGKQLDDESYGMDLASYLHKGMTQREVITLPRLIEAELKKDERVDTVQATLTQEGSVWRIRIEGTSGLGPFRLIASVDEAAKLIFEDEA
ncbi:MAG: hypothetical protein H6718_04075 [Polyangiaceae bacterium]|nr:hypothetical protein [Polyangiaceae bacterium]